MCVERGQHFSKVLFKMLLSSTLSRLVFSAFVLATSANAQGLNAGLTVKHISVALTVSPILWSKVFRVS